MRSGGGVLCVSVLQFLVGLALLIIYETYKVGACSALCTCCVTLPAPNALVCRLTTSAASQAKPIHL